MRLLMIAGDRSVLSGKKGAFWYTLEELRKQWERIDVICPSEVKSEERRVKSEEVEIFPNVFFYPCPGHLWVMPKWILEKGTALIHEHHHDVMTVLEFPPFYTGAGARALAQRTGIPYVAEVHHIVGYPRPADFRELVGRWMSRIRLPGAVKRAAATRVVNSGVRDQLISWGAPAEKICVVPSFYLDAHVYHPVHSGRATYDLVFCGRIVANKNLRSLIIAMAKLPAASLLVIGDGPERVRMENLARQLDLSNRVTFAGWLPSQEDVAKAFYSARMFVMPSYSEGGPRVALEAMACGLPVAATRVGVMPDVVREGVNGLFIKPSPDAIARTLQPLLADHAALKRMGTEAARITETFERTTCIRAYADFLKHVAGSEPVC